jgi:hypothetical protein
MIDYEQTDPLAADALEAWLTSPALPYKNDPIGHHSRQREVAKAGQNLEDEAFAQMCLDYLSAPGKIIDRLRKSRTAACGFMRLFGHCAKPRPFLRWSWFLSFEVPFNAS